MATSRAGGEKKRIRIPIVKPNYKPIFIYENKKADVKVVKLELESEPVNYGSPGFEPSALINTLWHVCFNQRSLLPLPECMNK